MSAEEIPEPVPARPWRPGVVALACVAFLAPAVETRPRGGAEASTRDAAIERPATADDAGPA